MPPDQRQLNDERIAALVDVLEQEGILPTEIADELKNADGIGRAPEVAKAHAEGRSP